MPYQYPSLDGVAVIQIVCAMMDDMTLRLVLTSCYFLPFSFSMGRFYWTVFAFFLLLHLQRSQQKVRLPSGGHVRRTLDKSGTFADFIHE